MTKHNDPLPSCSCGAATWSDHGCSIGGPLAQFGKRCNVCDRVAQELHHAGGVLFIVPVNQTFAPTLDAWFNGPVMAMLRTRGAAFDSAYNDRRAGDLASVNAALQLPENTRGDTVPDHLRRKWSSMLDEKDREARDEVRSRPEFRDGPIPPRVPADVLCYTRSASGWVRRTTAETADLVAPVDPIRLAHDKCFAAIFDAVRSRRWVNITPREIPNRYYSDTANIEPWFAFEVRGIAFVIGPRKRVISIEAKPLDGARVCDAIDRIAKDDEVTFNRSRESVLVHAWSDEKAIEYLCAMIGGAL